MYSIAMSTGQLAVKDWLDFFMFLKFDFWLPGLAIYLVKLMKLNQMIITVESQDSVVCQVATLEKRREGN